MPKILALLSSLTKASTALSTPVNTGTLNSPNGSIPKTSSSHNRNPLTLSDMTNSLISYACYFSSMTCSMLAATIPSKKLKIPSQTVSTSNFLVPPNGFSKCKFISIQILPTLLTNSDTFSTRSNIMTQMLNSLNAKLPSRPTISNDQIILEKKYPRLHFCSAVCTLIYLAYNTRADILFAVCKLAKACVCPGDVDFRALICLIGYLRRRPYYALKFYPDGTSNPVYEICRHHYISYSDLIIFSDASWQDCPDTGRSTVSYMIFYNGALIEANSTMLTPIAMSTSEAEYMAACSATMATAHIRMLLYDMMFLGTSKQWRRESTQRLPTTPTVLMIDKRCYRPNHQEWQTYPQDLPHRTSLPLRMSRTTRWYPPTPLDPMRLLTC